MAKFCGKCGKEINIDSGFCPNCWAEITLGENFENNMVTNNGSVSQTSEQNNNSDTKKDNAVTGFVFSLLGFLCCTYLAIPGVIISFLTFQDMNNGKVSSKNKALAIAGIILGILGIIIMIKNLISPDPTVTNLVNKMING